MITQIEYPNGGLLWTQRDLMTRRLKITKKE